MLRDDRAGASAADAVGCCDGEVALDSVFQELQEAVTLQGRHQRHQRWTDGHGGAAGKLRTEQGKVMLVRVLRMLRTLRRMVRRVRDRFLAKTKKLSLSMRLPRQWPFEKS